MAVDLIFLGSLTLEFSHHMVSWIGFHMPVFPYLLYSRHYSGLKVVRVNGHCLDLFVKHAINGGS